METEKASLAGWKLSLISGSLLLTFLLISYSAWSALQARTTRINRLILLEKHLLSTTTPTYVKYHGKILHLQSLSVPKELAVLTSNSGISLEVSSGGLVLVGDGGKR